jgi:hypothetical protein
MREFYGLPITVPARAAPRVIARGLQYGLTGLPAWGSGQPGQVGNQAALTVDSVPGVRLVNLH